MPPLPPHPPGLDAPTTDTLGAEEVVRRLGISRASLYSYVSRGWLRAAPDRSDPRISRYAAADVERLAQRQRRGRGARDQAVAAMEEGWPLLTTGLAGVVDGTPMMRGRSALALAEESSVEAAARWLWQTGEHDPFAGEAPRLPRLWATAARALRDRPLAERCAALYALAQPALPAACDWSATTQAAARSCGAHLRAVAACFHGRQPDEHPLPRQLARAWKLDASVEDTLRVAMILLADHEMNMVTFSGRCIASVGAPLGAALQAALCNVGAEFFGASLPRVEALWDGWTQQADPPAAMRSRLQRGRRPGFEHPDYPQGDPRGARLVALALRHASEPALVQQLQAAAALQPTIDGGLVALRRALGLPPEAAVGLLYASRCIGVIAHALEQRRSGMRLIARARYTPKAG